MLWLLLWHIQLHDLLFRLLTLLDINDSKTYHLINDLAHWELQLHAGVLNLRRLDRLQDVIHFLFCFNHQSIYHAILGNFDVINGQLGFICIHQILFLADLYSRTELRSDEDLIQVLVAERIIGLADGFVQDLSHDILVEIGIEIGHRVVKWLNSLWQQIISRFDAIRILRCPDGIRNGLVLRTGPRIAQGQICEISIFALWKWRLSACTLHWLIIKTLWMLLRSLPIVMYSPQWLCSWLLKVSNKHFALVQIFHHFVHILIL